MASTRPALFICCRLQRAEYKAGHPGSQELSPRENNLFPWEKLYGLSEAAIVTPGNSVATSLGRLSQSLTKRGGRVSVQ